MKTKIILLITLAFFINDAKGQIGRLPLSPLQKTEQNIGLTDITLVYSRPSMRGRSIFGELVPYNKLWRTGANRNTTVEFSEDVIINNKRVEKGKYAILSIPSEKQWEVIFYKDTDNWDVPDEFDKNKIAASILVASKHLKEAKEVFTITIGDFTNYTFDLNIYWSHTFVSIPINLSTKEIMDAKINKVLEGPDYNDYYAAAVYQMESGKEFKKGLDWINKAIEITDEVTWWDLRVKAILLRELGEFDASKKIAKEGLIKAEKKKREYGINEFKNLLTKLDK